MRKLTISVSDEVDDWVNDQVQKKRFRNSSHGYEFAVFDLMTRERT